MKNILFNDIFVIATLSMFISFILIYGALVGLLGGHWLLKCFQKNKWITFILFMLLASFLYISFDAVVQTGWYAHFDFYKASHYGAFIGGVFSFTSVILLVITLEKQISYSKLQSFENNFFQLLDYHRQNVLEMEFQGSKKEVLLKKHRIFVHIYREIVSVKEVIKQEIKEFDINEEFFDKEFLLNIKRRKIDIYDLELNNIAYLIVFFGVSEESLPILDSHFKDKYLDKMRGVITKLRKKKEDGFVTNGGHQHRLGHYFRNMFNLVCYVDRQSFLSKEQKKMYLKIFRSQLSIYEQLVLAFSSLSKLGIKWELANKEELNHFITKYELIKNVPENNLKGISIRKYYPKIEYEGLDV